MLPSVATLYVLAYQAEDLLSRRVSRAHHGLLHSVGKLILFIVIVLIVIGVLIGVGVSRLFRRGPR